MVTTSPTTPAGVQPPVGTAISQTYISVSWQSPAAPNGPNIRYELTRIKLRQPLESQCFFVLLFLYVALRLIDSAKKG